MGEGAGFVPTHTAWVSLPGGAAGQEPTACCFLDQAAPPPRLGIYRSINRLKFLFLSVYCRASQLKEILPLWVTLVIVRPRQGMLLASSGWRPETTSCDTQQSPQQRRILLAMAVVLRLRKPSVDQSEPSLNRWLESRPKEECRGAEQAQTVASSGEDGPFVRTHGRLIVCTCTPVFRKLGLRHFQQWGSTLNLSANLCPY